MKKFIILISIIITTFVLYSLDAAQLTIKEDLDDGVYSSKSSPFTYTILTENQRKIVSFHKTLSLNEDVFIQSALPIEFNSNLKCNKLSITYTNSSYKIHNNGRINCTNLSVVHAENILYFVNKGTCIFRKINQNFEKRAINLENFILKNKLNGTILTQFHINFTWNRNHPSERFVYDIQKTADEARIQNYGVIKGTQNIDLDTSVYMSENSIISTHRSKKIRFSQERNYPVYALTRIPQSDLISYVKGELLPGQLGEKAAVHYYTKFENISLNNITSFKANNSDNGIDLMCATSPQIIVHECKNYSDSSFSLSSSKNSGNQCSKKWIEGHFEGMKKVLEKNKTPYASNDPLLIALQETNTKDQKLYQTILNTTAYSQNGVLKNSLPENKLILNGNSIYHVQTPIKPIPLYYCQRNIDEAFSK